MRREELRETLRRTLEDRRLSRGERKALGEVLGDWLQAGAGPEHQRRLLQHEALELAEATLQTPGERAVLQWLRDVWELARPGTSSSQRAEAWFGPGDGPRSALKREIDAARAHLAACVFTITDDRLTQALLAAHRRGVRVRILTDDEKRSDRGSDIDQLVAAGVGVREDRTAAHMHHKFALFDGRVLATGSYNWTRSAAVANHENLLLTSEPRLVRAFEKEFEALWDGAHPSA